MLEYQKGQDGRGGAPRESYAAFFETGTISPVLVEELMRRYSEKHA